MLERAFCHMSSMGFGLLSPVCPAAETHPRDHEATPVRLWEPFPSKPRQQRAVHTPNRA